MRGVAGKWPWPRTATLPVKAPAGRQTWVHWPQGGRLAFLATLGPMARPVSEKQLASGMCASRHVLAGSPWRRVTFSNTASSGSGRSTGMRTGIVTVYALWALYYGTESNNPNPKSELVEPHREHGDSATRTAVLGNNANRAGGRSIGIVQLQSPLAPPFGKPRKLGRPAGMASDVLAAPCRQTDAPLLELGGRRRHRKQQVLPGIALWNRPRKPPSRSVRHSNVKHVPHHVWTPEQVHGAQTADGIIHTLVGVAGGNPAPFGVNRHAQHLDLPFGVLVPAGVRRGA